MMKKNRTKIIAGIIILISLIVAFFKTTEVPQNQNSDEEQILETVIESELNSEEIKQPPKEAPKKETVKKSK